MLVCCFPDVCHSFFTFCASVGRQCFVLFLFTWRAEKHVGHCDLLFASLTSKWDLGNSAWP